MRELRNTSLSYFKYNRILFIRGYQNQIGIASICEK